jgi:cation transport ATPase
MKRTFRLIGLDCAHCAAKMEQGISSLAGVKQATVNFLTTKMIIEAEDEKMAEIVEEAKKIIHKLEPQVEIR